MHSKRKVHKARVRPKTTTARGVRMSTELWEFAEGQAKALGDRSVSAIIERWVREKREAVEQVA